MSDHTYEDRQGRKFVGDKGDVQRSLDKRKSSIKGNVQSFEKGKDTVK